MILKLASITKYPYGYLAFYTECGKFEVVNAIEQATQLHVDVSNTPVSKRICDGSEGASYPTWAPDAAGKELLLKPTNSRQRPM